MRRRVLGSFDPHAARPADRLYTSLVLLGRPAPFLLRAVAVVFIITSLGATASVVAADSLPDEPLYGVKLATEQARLSFATTAEDRATVELSIAEHRLDEAVRLVDAGREDDALEASGAYGTHVAAAAAELATVAPSPRLAALVGQLETRLVSQRQVATKAAARLAADPRAAPAAAVLATVSATAAPVAGSSAAARIAASAAAFGDRVAAAAADRSRAAEAATARPIAPARLPGSPLPVASPRPVKTIDPVAARLAAERTREAAARAHKAAEAAARTATPDPRRSAVPSASATPRR